MKHKIEVDVSGRILHSYTIYGEDYAPDRGIEVDSRIDIDKYNWDHETQRPVEKIKPDIDRRINKKSIKADGKDKIILTDLPNPTTITFDTTNVFVVEDGTFEFTIDTPGKHKFKIDTGIYLTEEIEIDAS